MKKLLLTVLALTSTSAQAHTGHLFNESVHGFLHAEHVIALAIIGIVALSIHILRNK
jgi:hypothetical protein